jgi:hypothetical protein
MRRMRRVMEDAIDRRSERPAGSVAMSPPVLLLRPSREKLLLEISSRGCGRSHCLEEKSSI